MLPFSLSLSLSLSCSLISPVFPVERKNPRPFHLDTKAAINTPNETLPAVFCLPACQNKCTVLFPLSPMPQFLRSHSIRSFVDKFIPGPHQDKKSSMAHLVGVNSAVTHATDAQMAYALQPKESKYRSPFVWSWLNCSREGSEQAKKGLDTESCLWMYLEGRMRSRGEVEKKCI
ncbi:hypothetical protein B0T21DRAFT_201915 [Apiosordaria backusii]|uniref:Uncharacterized protein n=1 Tax=Apiosordaria backusii TaxID=314023 RepID=A0AA40BF70_9PEZI|nr:hypothetical protein B0T21DRAFT_201915 [Apiosordaria backusii]